MINLLEMSAMAGILIIFVIILRALFIHKLPKKTFTLLWAIVVLRLIIPFSLPILPSINTAYDSNIPILNYAGQNTNVNDDIYIKSPEIDDNGIINTDTEAIDNNTKAISVNVFRYTKEIVWLIGVMITMLYFISVHMHFKNDYLSALPTGMTVDGFGVKRKVQIKMSDKINNPLTYRIINPVIIIPKSMELSDEKMTYIITHEMVHIKRFDVLYKWVLTCAVCLHWFNPLVWVMYVRANRDIEISCDESVVKLLGGKRSEYALALLSLEEKRSVSGLYSSFSRNAVKERIEAIMKLSKRTSAISIAAAIGIVVLTSVVFATTKDKPTIDYINEQDAVVTTYVNKNEDVAKNDLSDDIQPTENIHEPLIYLASDFAEYESYGLTFDSSDNSLHFNGKEVLYLIDSGMNSSSIRYVRTKSGENLSIVYIQRDENGNIIKPNDNTAFYLNEETGVKYDTIGLSVNEDGMMMAVSYKIGYSDNDSTISVPFFDSMNIVIPSSDDEKDEIKVTFNLLDYEIKFYDENGNEVSESYEGTKTLRLDVQTSTIDEEEQQMKLQDQEEQERKLREKEIGHQIHIEEQENSGTLTHN